MSQGMMILIEFPPTSRDGAQEYAARVAKLIHEEFVRRGHKARYEPVKGRARPGDKSTMEALERDAAAKLGSVVVDTSSHYLPPLTDDNNLPDVNSTTTQSLADEPLLRNQRRLRLGPDTLILTDREARALIAVRRESGRGRAWVTTSTLYAVAYAGIELRSSTESRRKVADLLRSAAKRYPDLHLTEARPGRYGGFRWTADHFDLRED